MADPVSVTGLILQVGGILSSLINYAKTVQGAKSDIRRLSEELFALKGILEHLSSEMPRGMSKWLQTEAPITYNREIMARVLHSTSEFLQSLLRDLEPPETKFKQLKQKLQWPFNQDQVNAHLVQLERVKSWLMLVLMSDHLSIQREMQNDMKNLAKDLRDDLRIRNQERVEMANRELFQWLAPVSPANIHLQASKGQKVETGKWFIDGHLKRWVRSKSDDERILFLIGKSGTGKTTLFAQTVDELTSMASRDPSLCFAYFYCSITNDASQVPRNILGSLAAQLSGTDPSILDDIKPAYEKTAKTHAHRQPLELSALENAIIRVASGKANVIILIDAVNESQERERVEGSLLRIASLASNIHILATTTALVTTRPPKQAKVLSISAEMMRGDIERFIQYRLSSDDTLRSLPLKLKAEIESALLYNADGSFRWVQLSLDNLSSQRTARAMRDALKTLPSTLRETYAGILERIAPNDWKYAREAVFWLSFVRRPITLRSLNEAVVVDESSTFFDEDMMLLPPNILLHICQGLISIDQLGYVSLAHSSVKEFLTSDWIRDSRVGYFSLDPATANAAIMRRCLAYLCLDNFKSGYSTSMEDCIARMEAYRFLHYAAYWPDHCASLELGENERRLINKFFDTRHLDRRGNFGVWIETLIPGAEAEIIEMTHPLYYAASFGMVPVVKAILATDEDLEINAPGGRVGATALFAAAWRHNYEVVDILIKAGADPTIKDPGTDASVLHLAELSKFAGLRDSLNWWKAQRRGTTLEAADRMMVLGRQFRADLQRANVARGIVDRTSSQERWNRYSSQADLHVEAKR